MSPHCRPQSSFRRIPVRRAQSRNGKCRGKCCRVFARSLASSPTVSRSICPRGSARARRKRPIRAARFGSGRPASIASLKTARIPATAWRTRSQLLPCAIRSAIRVRTSARVSLQETRGGSPVRVRERARPGAGEALASSLLVEGSADRACGGTPCRRVMACASRGRRRTPACCLRDGTGGQPEATCARMASIDGHRRNCGERGSARASAIGAEAPMGGCQPWRDRAGACTNRG